MGVFTVMMLALMQFFNSAQKLWTGSEKRVGTFGDARVAMSLMSTMLQTAFYENDGNIPSNGLVPFSVDVAPANYDRIAFVTDTSYALDEDSTSRLYEVAFKVDPADDHKLKILFIGDKHRTTYPTAGWNFYGGFEPARITDIFTFVNATEESIIPYVMELKFTCFDKDMNALATSVAFPHAVMVKISLLDKNTYIIWKEKAGGGTINDPATAGTAEAQEYLNNNKRTFTTIIYIGDRGQG